MTLEPHTQATRLAVVERTAPDMVVVRYREGISFDPAGIAEVIDTCERIALQEHFGLVTLLPQDGEMSIEAMQQDHGGPDFARRVRAHAIVAGGELFKRLSEIHYTYHPQPHEVRLFEHETDAREWVRARLDDRSVA
jgi:hypothetical protein